MATKNRGRRGGRRHNRKPAAHRNTASAPRRNRRRAVAHNRVSHRRRHRNTTGGMGSEVVIGGVAGLTALAINYLSPYVPLLSDSGISGAIKKGIIGLVVRMLAKFLGASANVTTGITVGTIVAVVVQAAGSLGVSLPNSVIPLPRTSSGAVPAAAIQAQGAAAAGNAAPMGYLRPMSYQGTGNQWNGMNGIARVGSRYGRR